MVKSKKSYWKHSIECKDHKNNKYSSMTELARAYGLTQECLSRRLKVYQWDLERALTTPTKNSPQRIYDHCGNWFRSLSELACYYNMDRKTLTYRINSGWSIEDALTKPSRCKNKRQKTPHI